MTTHTVNLLPGQAELIADTETPVLGYVGGLRSGKTFGMLSKLAALTLENAPLPSMVVMPKFRDFDRILIPTWRLVADEWGLSWRYKVSERTIYVETPAGVAPVWLASGDNPDSIAGPTVAHAMMDEAGQQDHGIYKQLNARVSHPASRVRQTIVGGTPEGINWYADLFEGKDADKRVMTDARGRDRGPDGIPMKRLIRARTRDNWHLPPGYVDANLSGYTPIELLAYESGLFVPPTGRVYTRFDRRKHARDVDEPLLVNDGRLDLYMLCDFNVDHMAWFLAYEFGGQLFVFDELYQLAHDTLAMGEIAAERWSDWLSDEWAVLTKNEAARRVTVICDPAGAARQSAGGATISDTSSLRSLGFTVEHRTQAPRIKDRVWSVQLGFAEDRIWVHAENCPYLVRCLTNQERNAKGEPDKSKDLDHGPDALGYGVHFLWPAYRPRGNQAEPTTHSWR